MFDRHSPAFREIAARGVIRQADVQRLVREHLFRPIATEAEAEALLDLDASCPVQDISWSPLLIDTIRTFIISAVQPEGYMTAGKARWLTTRVAVDGKVGRLTCLELLIEVLETARWAPPSLAAFVLRQVERDITTGTGPLRTAATSGKGRVAKSAVDLMRRVLAASNRGDSSAITRAEAEVLLDLHDATAMADNCLEWSELFTKAMANVLMTASGYAAPARAEALQPESWLDPSRGFADFLQSMTARGFAAVLEPYKQRSIEDRALAHLEHHKVEIITAEIIPEIDPVWLALRLGNTPVLTPATRALLGYLRTQTRVLHPALKPLLDKAA